MNKGFDKNKYIGDRAFYKMVLMIAIPMMIQNGITNLVGLLDNLMIGRVGTNELSGVAIANQLFFVYMLLIFGATAGAGIFTAQYFGLGNNDGVRITFRFKILFNLILSVISILVFLIFATNLVGVFLHGEGSAKDAEQTLKIGITYIRIMTIGLIPVAISNAYAGTLRDIGQTKVPMYAATVAIFVNLIGNFLLIYGYCGMPKLGAAGAAIATVISRFAEMITLIIYTHKNSDKYPFIKGAFSDFRIPPYLAQKFLLKSIPLMANETLWALGQTVMSQSYSYRSLDAVAALNIEVTLWNFLGVSFLAVGEAIAIIAGQILGSGDIDKARDHATKMIVFTVFLGTLCSAMMLLISPFYPKLYNTSDSIRNMATSLILIQGALMPLYAYNHASYFVIRAGGRVMITLLFDSVFVWIITVPAAFILSRFTHVGVIEMVLIVQSMELIKCISGYIMVKSGIWAKNIVKE